MPLFGRPTPDDEPRADAYRAWLIARHPLAIASVVLGVFSMLEFGTLIVPGVAAIVLGLLALRRLCVPAPEGPGSGHRLAWTGILLGVVSLAIAVFLYARRG